MKNGRLEELLIISRYALLHSDLPCEATVVAFNDASLDAGCGECGSKNHTIIDKDFGSRKKMVKAIDLVDPTIIPTEPTKYGFKLKTSFILMQYTGLKDKNGKEIYEGDILKDADGFIVQIYYSNGEYSTLTTTKETLKMADWLDKGNEPDELKWHDCEIIGNIYENPELLKK